MTEYVVGFLFDPTKKRVVLQEKKRGPVWMHGRLNGPGGMIEEYELPAVAMAREYEEETGMKTLPHTWRFLLSMYGDHGDGWRVYYFFTFGDVSIPTQRGSEPVATYGVVPLTDKVVPDLNWLIPMCLCEPLMGQSMPTRLYVPSNHDLGDIYPVDTPVKVT